MNVGDGTRVLRRKCQSRIIHGTETPSNRSVSSESVENAWRNIEKDNYILYQRFVCFVNFVCFTMYWHSRISVIINNDAA